MYNNQCGRSMIEMLGVLAIIGVLSIGGIAGYNKAMNNHKVNKTIEQVLKISQGMRKLYSKQRDYSDLDYRVLRRANIVPEEMWVGSFDGAGDALDTIMLNNAFGGNTEILGVNASKSYYYISMQDIPQEACIELAARNWEKIAAGFIGVGINVPSLRLYAGCEGELNYMNGATACVDGAYQAAPMPMELAATACYSAYSNNLIWSFR